MTNYIPIIILILALCAVNIYLFKVITEQQKNN